MARGQSVRQVDQPVSTAWRVVADHENIATWGPGMSVRMERNGESDPLGVGAIRVVNWPVLPSIREEVTAFEPNRRMAYRALSGLPFADWAGEIELAERAGGTTIRWSLTARTSLPGANLILDLTAWFLLSALVRAIRRAG